MKLELQLPSNLQSALSARAHSRSVEDKARLLLETALEPLKPDSEREQLTVLDDAELWRVASQTVSIAESERMQRLTERRKTVGLPAEASGELERLQHYAERVMLLRAEAAALLKRREHDTLSICADEAIDTWFP